jgi:hypothetical protein
MAFSRLSFIKMKQPILPCSIGKVKARDSKLSP